MAPVTKICRNNARHVYEITDEDQKFYKKIEVPPPVLCPDCRLQQRLSFRNERKLYNRKCDLSGKEIISMYSPDKSYKVYEQEEWWSDKWDPLEYGQEFDFNRPFFDQFNELFIQVPRIALLNERIENSKYCNYVATSKNCYLCYGAMDMEDCLYSSYLFDTRSLIDCLGVKHTELGYESIDCTKVYNCSYCQNCSGSHDLFFCYDCIACNKCIGCAGLRHKEYCIFNKGVSKEQYEKALEDIKNNPTVFQKLKERFEKLKQQTPRKFASLENTEQCTGDYLVNSKNSQDSYYSDKIQDCRFVHNVVNNKDCYDLQNCENSELCYACSSGNTNYNTIFFDGVCTSKYVYYSSICLNSQHLFGCIGLKRNQYCILNKQYTKEEYENLVVRIIQHMKKTEEWGEFFPVSLAPYGYNETLANEYCPLIREQALKLEVKWKEDDTINRYEGPKAIVPDSIKDVKDEITKQILTCETCGKNYKIIIQELKFYRDMGLPVPKNCPDCRHKARLALRNPRKLWDRQCMKCRTNIKTSYSPDRKEIVYCKKCYNETTY